jgi:single-strand DNA-binding protein
LENRDDFDCENVRVRPIDVHATLAHEVVLTAEESHDARRSQRGLALLTRRDPAPMMPEHPYTDGAPPMAGVNKAILIGNLGRDPELRYTQSGQPVANFTLATTETWNKKDGGGKEEKTEWHRIVAWGRTAELCAQYLAKGRTVYVEGRLQTREWEDREGKKQRTTEVVAQTVQFLGGNRGAAGAGGAGASAPAAGSFEAATPEPPPDDDIPF